MKILIDIEGFVNRGDQLMFCAIAEAVQAHRPNAELVLPPKLLSRRELRQLSDLPFRELVDCRKVGRRLTAGLTGTLSRLGLCPAPVWPAQVDLVLHAPGYRYSDAFPLRRADSIRQDVSYFRAFSKSGRRIVFLPQAFGPFDTDGARSRIRAIVPFADEIYARDATSFAHLKALFPKASNIFRAPDFTCGCRGRLPPGFALRRYGVIIPNGKMISHTELGAALYLDFLCAVASLFRENGLDVVLLNHEGAGDRKIIDDLRNRIEGPITCFNDVTGLDCKGIIGGAALVVTSRFHGAVSGFCQGVPTLCTGWSHKYRELAAEFGCPESCLDPKNPEKSLAAVADALRHPSAYAADAAHVTAVTDRTSSMWASVFAGLQRKGDRT